MTNSTHHALRTAALVVAVSTTLGIAGARANDFNPSSNHDATTDRTADTTATESLPSAHHPPSVQSTQNFGTTASPSTADNEAGPVENACEYDLNGDGYVDFEDYLVLLAIWSRHAGTTTESSSGSATMVDYNSILGLLSAWGSC